MKHILIGFLLAAAFVVSGCTAELHHDLSETQANEIVVALEDVGIEASKYRDETDKTRWVIAVPSGVQVEAWKVLETRGLPRPEVEGFTAFFPREGLVPTSEEERVVMQFATAQELRRTLMAVDGVVDAHVNLVVPQKRRLGFRADETRPQPKASVLLKASARNDGKPPIAEKEVKTIVAGAVEELMPENVSVVLTPVDTTAEAPEVRVISVGPVTVAEGNKGVLQGFIAVLMLAILALAGALGFVVFRFRSRPA